MQITLTDAFVQLIHDKGLADKDLILIADDGGGKYSLQGGACTIGSKFTLIEVDQPDADYPVALENKAGLKLWSSDYDLLFLEAGLQLDFVDHQIRLKDNAHRFDDGLRIAKGSEVLAAFHIPCQPRKLGNSLPRGIGELVGRFYCHFC